MKISQLINKLEKIQHKYGDIPICAYKNWNDYTTEIYSSINVRKAKNNPMLEIQIHLK